MIDLERSPGIYIYIYIPKISNHNREGFGVTLQVLKQIFLVSWMVERTGGKDTSLDEISLERKP